MYKNLEAAYTAMRIKISELFFTYVGFDWHVQKTHSRIVLRAYAETGESTYYIFKWMEVIDSETLQTNNVRRKADGLATDEGRHIQNRPLGWESAACEQDLCVDVVDKGFLS